MQVHKTIGIAGAGVMGRLAALKLAERGWQVSLFDADAEEGRESCTWVGAGMLAPSCELETAETEIALYGDASMAEWPVLLSRLDGQVYMEQHGSLVVAHPADRAELERLKGRVARKCPDPERMDVVDAARIAELEPGLAGRFLEGVFFPREAHLDNRDLLAALGSTLKRMGVTWHARKPVDAVTPGVLCTGTETHQFDAVLDCRGMGAKAQLSDLRGIRGELLYVRAPEVPLTRPVRLMHPRYPIYIVPRRDHVFVIGATAIESEDYTPITVRSALELLSAAYTVHPAFAEGRILETATQCRPAFPDNLPRLCHADGLLRINGLYRHGFLISPALAEFACLYLEGAELPANAAAIMRREEG